MLWKRELLLINKQNKAMELSSVLGSAASILQVS